MRKLAPKLLTENNTGRVWEVTNTNQLKAQPAHKLLTENDTGRVWEVTNSNQLKAHKKTGEQVSLLPGARGRWEY